MGIFTAILATLGIGSSIASLISGISNANLQQEMDYTSYMQELENYLNTSNYLTGYYDELISEYDKYINRDYDIDRAALEATEKSYAENLTQAEIDRQVQAQNWESFGYDLIAQDKNKDIHATNVQKYESDLAAYDATLQSYDNTIAELRNAWGATSIQNAASGNLTGSAALIAEAQKSAVVRAAGDSMTLKKGEGYMGQKWQSDLYDFMNQKSALDAEAIQLKQSDIALQQTQLGLQKADSQLAQHGYELQAQGYELEASNNQLADSLENAYKNKADAEKAKNQTIQNIEKTYSTMEELDKEAGKIPTDYRARDGWTLRDDSYAEYQTLSKEEQDKVLASGKMGNYTLTDDDKLLWKYGDSTTDDSGQMFVEKLSDDEKFAYMFDKNKKLNGRELTKSEREYLKDWFMKNSAGSGR